MNRKKSKGGRKPLPKSEKKIQIYFFPTGRQIELVGGRAAAVRIAMESLEKTIQNLDKRSG
jgi:hypothetical protein